MSDTIKPPHADSVNAVAQDLSEEVSKSHVQSDVSLYSRKAQDLRERIAACDQEFADATRNAKGWASRADAAAARKDRLRLSLRAVRVAQRAMEDARDDI